MSKREYLERNMDAVLDVRSEPFKNVDNVEKGLFNYQYFNAMAKNSKARMERNASRPSAEDTLSELDYFYSKKDGATMRVLRLLDCRGVEAYYIKVRSTHLKEKLFEIIIEEYGMILHSTNAGILNYLKEEGVFSEEKKRSLIDGYVNQKY
jgi:hypothetical protein